MSGITYRRLATPAELTPCQALQAIVWNMPDPGDVVPMHQLFTAVKYGGVVVGAFDGARLVGMSYGFAGLYKGQCILCSHMNAVLPAYRGHGIGYHLKVEQRRAALEVGYSLVHWTYDPLQLVNGNLNIRRLGGESTTYVRELYGEMRDGLNAGLPSDRLVVEWHINTERVERALAEGAAPGPDRSECFPYDGLLLPGDGQPLALTLPARFQELKKTDAEAALRWRLRSRRAFERAFEAGYRLTGADGQGYIFTK